MDHLWETLAFWGGVSMDHDKCRHKPCREKKFSFICSDKKAFLSFFSNNFQGHQTPGAR